MHNHVFRLTAFSLALSLASPLLSAQEEPLTEEQTKRVETLTTEIEKLTTELNTLKSKMESGASAEEIEAETAKVESAAADVVGEAQDVEEELKIWTGDVELGYVNTTGNTEESSMKSKADITREKEAWRFTIFYDSLNTKSDGERTAERYYYSNRLAYAYNEHDYSFVFASYDDDRFSGFDYQATASIGYGRRIYNEESLKWDVEVGPGYRYSKYDDTDPTTEGVSEEAILRMFTKLDWEITDATTFSQSLSVEAGDDNTISKSITSLKTEIIGSLSLKLSYTVKYTDEVPADRSHADEETAVTLAYSF